MKKLINDPKSVVRDMLAGIAGQSAKLALLADETVVVRHPLGPPETRPVAIISGGGSGHEPAHAGFVGEGMLTAAVAGEVFTSPSTDAVLAAIRASAGPKGALLIVKNYTGDRLNFGLAAELARGEGIPVAVVVVADDVALRDTVEPARRRGVAGTVLVHKIAGAVAARGGSLEDVEHAARDAASRIGTMGVALSACTVPAVGHPGFVLADDEIEIGLGIHGEAGVERSTMRTASELTELMIDVILEDRAPAAGNKLALLVNGLGGTPPMELEIVAGAALRVLRERGLTVVRVYVGTFLSALDMLGCSLSVMELAGEDLALLDAPTDALAWPHSHDLPAGGPIVLQGQPTPIARDTEEPRDPDAGLRLRAAATAAAHALIAAEPELTELDTRAGDGDLGTSMMRGAEAILSLPDSAWNSPSQGLAAMGDALRRAIGGSSGPFYATALLRAARHVADHPLSPKVAAEAFSHAIDAIATLGGARKGDRTMLDALLPASAALAEAVGEGHGLREAWKAASEAAAEGARVTATMHPRLGRASYLGARAVGQPDGGARAVAIWLSAVAAEQDGGSGQGK